MAITNSIIELTGTAQLVVPPSNNPQRITMHNMSKSINNYSPYGAVGCTTSNSPHIDPGETLKLDLMPGESLFALSDPTGLDLGILIQRQP